jgi:membrane fusion protein (multidrug efflux system)
MSRWSLAIPISILAVAAALLFVIRGHWDSWRSDAVLQETNDAYVAADQIPLSTRVSGTVRLVAVQDYQAVKAGQLLVELDNIDYGAVVDEAQSAVRGAKAELAANRDTKLAADASVRAAGEAIAQAEAVTSAGQAAITATQAQVTQAVAEYQRQSALLADGAATRQQFEQAQEARDAAQATLQSRQADLLRAKASVAAARAAQVGALQQRAALNAKDVALTAEIAARTAGLAGAKVNLDYTRIVAPSDGHIGRLQVHRGQLLGAGVQIADFVQNGSWIEANFLETQLAKVRIGDVVDVKIDAFPSRLLHGHVAEIAPASGSASALLPPDNATGNFTKVVQRVPVKVLLDEQSLEEPLRPGLSAEVVIHTDRIEAPSSQPPAVRP